MRPDPQGNLVVLDRWAAGLLRGTYRPAQAFVIPVSNEGPPTASSLPRQQTMAWLVVRARTATYPAAAQETKNRAREEAIGSQAD